MLDLGGGYTDVFTLWILLELYMYNLCNFFYVYFSKKLIKILKFKFKV